MFPQRLRLARKRAGLSLRELADRMGGEVSHQAIKKYEDGEMYPSSRTLVALGRALGVSLDFLMSGQVEELVGVEFRQHSGTTQRDLARVEAAVIEAVERYLEVEGVLGLEEDTVNLGTIVDSSPVQSLEVVEQRAMELREYWQLGQAPIASVTTLLEERGFRVIEGDLPDDVFGLTCRVRRAEGKASISVIVVGRNNQNLERRRFTLAHELAHQVLPNVADEVRKENAMNRFAGALLIPKEHLRKEIGEERRAVAYWEIRRLKHMYGVSASALLMRLRDVHILSPESYLTALKTYARGWRKIEPDPLDINIHLQFEQPTRFTQLVYRALAERMLSLPRAAELIGNSIEEIEMNVRGTGRGHPG